MIPRQKFFLLAGCMALLAIFALAWDSREARAPQPVMPAPTSTTPVADTSIKRLTAEQAGISATTTNPNDLAFIRSISETNGVRSISIDPVKYVNCQQLRVTKKPLPKSCQNDPDQLFAIENPDTRTTTLTLAADAGPYFISYVGGDQLWTTMDLRTMQGLMAGTISPESLGNTYYSLHLRAQNGLESNLFYIIRNGNTATKVFQRYEE